MTEFRVEPLSSKTHDRKSFNCGRPSLDRYLQRQARQAQRARANAVFVMARVEKPKRIVGFYSLCGVGIDPGVVPKPALKRLPLYPQVSAFLLGQLAIDREFQGRGLGGVLLVDALKRAHAATNSVGAVMVVTDPLDESAAEFYVKHGFQRFENLRRMFLPMATIARLFTTT